MRGTPKVRTKTIVIGKDGQEVTISRDQFDQIVDAVRAGRNEIEHFIFPAATLQDAYDDWSPTVVSTISSSDNVVYVDGSATNFDKAVDWRNT